MGDECCDNKEPPTSVDAVFRPGVPGLSKPLLTPDDVHHKRFATVRLREGYDLAEVDTFLHEVESTLDRLFREMAALRQQACSAADLTQRNQLGNDHAERVLTLADRTAGEVITQASAEATRIVREAQSRAEAVEREAHARAAQIEQEALDRVSVVHQDADTKEAELESLHRARNELERQAEALRSLVSDYRAGLWTALDGHFDAIERKATEVLQPAGLNGSSAEPAPTAGVHRQDVTPTDEPRTD
ncbi:DivIVA domain-containing protein [Streptomyces lydicus]|uniref:DivIVA domain-containing protein n=1 Tax=Streptomyces lydicus TaxID=47763 RepID=UPI0037B96F54